MPLKQSDLWYTLAQRERDAGEFEFGTPSPLPALSSSCSCPFGLLRPVIESSALCWPWDWWWNHLDFTHSHPSATPRHPVSPLSPMPPPSRLPCTNRSPALCWSWRLCSPSLSPSTWVSRSCQCVVLPACWGLQSGSVGQGGGTCVESVRLRSALPGQPINGQSHLTIEDCLHLRSWTTGATKRCGDTKAVSFDAFCAFVHLMRSKS